MAKLFDRTIHYFLLTIIFIFPFFFLPITQEFFLTGKLYFLGFFSLFLLLISLIQFINSKKLTWRSTPIDTPIFLFIVALALSILFSSPNKIAALVNPNFGLAAIIFLTIIYFYLSRKMNKELTFMTILSYSGFLLSLLTIVFFFQPFKNTSLPQSLQFLKNPAFTPVGSFLDLAFILGFFLIHGLTRIFKDKETQVNSNKNIIHYSLLIINLTALSLTLYSLLKPVLTNFNQFQPFSTNLPPFRLSWYAAIEILKKIDTAIFGVGIDNFSSIFTQVKDLAYNQSSLWQINSFSLSRSTILHILTETGLFGLLAFILLLFQAFKLAFVQKDLLPLFGYSLFIIAFFPPSLIVWFLFFIVLSQLSTKALESSHQNLSEINLAAFPPVYLGISAVSFLFIIIGGYFLGRSYLSEYYFKKGLDGVAKNDARQAYDNIRQAIVLNPFIERYRISFSQLNLLIAEGIAAKANQPQGKDKKPYQLTEQDRQNITQAIQTAISESKAAVTLNPQKALHWENLAGIYRNIIGTAQGADVWTVSAFQRAIVADPQNPIYRLNLGGIYYSLGNFEEAARLFEQTVSLKPDWANAHYNLAWADYQRQNYQRAVAEMQNAIALLNPQKDKTDLEKAQKELEEFKKKLPKEEKQATESAGSQPSKLSLPTPPTTQISPKIELPKEASPEAK